MMSGRHLRSHWTAIGSLRSSTPCGQLALIIRKVRRRVSLSDRAAACAMWC
jgi:hypothetical protein